MATTDGGDDPDYSGELVPSEEDASPLLFSAHPAQECPECGAGGFKKVVDVTYSESEGVVFVAAVECEQCGLYAETERV